MRLVIISVFLGLAGCYESRIRDLESKYAALAAMDIEDTDDSGVIIDTPTPENSEVECESFEVWYLYVLPDTNILRIDGLCLASAQMFAFDATGEYYPASPAMFHIRDEIGRLWDIDDPSYGFPRILLEFQDGHRVCFPVGNADDNCSYRDPTGTPFPQGNGTSARSGAYENPHE